MPNSAVRTWRRAPLEYEGLTVDLDEHVVERDGRRLDLSPLEYKLLVTLLRRPRRVFTRDELLDDVWGDGRRRYGCGRTIHLVSSRLRSTKVSSSPLIQTIRGAGYTLRA